MVMSEEHETSNDNVKNDGFKLLRVKYQADSSVERHMFMKQFTLKYHVNKNEDKPENRTLFLINVPPFVTEQHIRYLFEKRCGQISRIFLQEKPSLATSTTIYNRIQTMETSDEPEIQSITQYFPSEDNQIVSYKVCYIVFAKPSGLTNALKMPMVDDSTIYCFKPSLSEVVSSEDFITGIKLWQKKYNESIVSLKMGETVAEKYLTSFDEKMVAKSAKEKELADSVPDAEGWVTVNRKLRRDRQALVSNQFFDQKIKDKYLDRERKRQLDEEQFEQSVNKLMLETGKKKKRRIGARIGVNKFDVTMENDI